MKNIVYYTALMLLLMGCNSSTTNTESQSASSSAKVLDIGEFMDAAESIIGEEINITGTVSHICSHSGKRCFIIDSTGNQSVRIEAKGDISSFNRELSGSDIVVTGIVQEKRLDKAYLDEWELELKDQEEDAEDGGEHCAAELNNIQEMRDWMKDKNKDYYSIFYIDGTSYSLLDEI